MVARESVNELAIVGTACTNIHKTTECSRWSRTKNATQTAATDLVYMQRRRSAPDKKPVAALRVQKYPVDRNLIKKEQYDWQCS